jgi:deferrochelatase/peroxidase EfeB
MTDGTTIKPSRRFFLGAAGGLAGGIAGAVATSGSIARAQIAPAHPQSAPAEAEPFYGTYQAGITTPMQESLYFASFDLVTDNRQDVVALLQRWTVAAARLTAGLPTEPGEQDDQAPALDTGETLGIKPARLTVTFGFGPELFSADGKDRYGIAHLRPAALIDLPRFNGDQLVPGQSGGALCIQACANDPQVAFHAVRQLARISYGTAQLKWVQSGFSTASHTEGTPRNLMGFKDGTMNPTIKAAPLGGHHEFDAPNFNATDADGNSIIPDNAHVRLAAPVNNEGAAMLRRSYSYNNGANFVAERWPPWHQGIEYDSGLFFQAYQKDPRTAFAKVFERMSKLDALNQFTTHVSSAIFACPPGVQQGSYIGQSLFTAA